MKAPQQGAVTNLHLQATQVEKPYVRIHVSRAVRALQADEICDLVETARLLWEARHIGRRHIVKRIPALHGGV